MDEKSYTIEEFRQALRETGNLGLATRFTDEIVAQMDKNRAVKQGGEFTGEQVRRAVRNRLAADNNAYVTPQRFAAEVVSEMRSTESEPEPADGGVYRRPSGVLYKRSGGFWQLFGDSGRFTDEQLNFPVSELERVL